MTSLQNQYNLLKEGKLAKDVFLKHVKEQFPQYIPNSMGLEPALNILKQKSVIREDSSYKEVVKEKDTFEADFKKFLAEAKKEEKSIKADLKKTDKSVDETNDAANYDNEDTKNADNVIFDQYMRGIYVEMSKDSKQDLETVKKKVLKNLTKDPIFYVKNGQFGVEGLGYTDEAESLKLSKTDKEEVLDKSKPKANVKDTLGKKESNKGAPKKVKEMSTTAKSSKGVKKMAPPSKGKVLKLKENQTLESLMNEVDGEDDKLDLGKLKNILLRAEKEFFESGDIDKEEYDEVVKYFNTWKNEKVSAKEWMDKHGEFWNKFVQDQGDSDNIYEILTDEFGLDDEKVEELMNQYYWNQDKDESLDENLNEESQYSKEDVSKMFDYHERTGMLPDDIDGDEFKALLKKYNITRDEDDEDDIDPAGGRGLHSHLEEDKSSQKENFLQELINKVLDEGSLEDTDATLAKQEADAEAKAAQLGRQRADNKTKIANANKNI